MVLRYKSDLPMIPIILTSVAATPNMGDAGGCWVRGDDSAQLLSHRHNDAQIDWLTARPQLNDVIIKAVGEAEGKHAFVTEFARLAAGDARCARSSWPLRYAADAYDHHRPVTFVEKALGMFVPEQSADHPAVARRMPLPSALAATGVTPATYYQQIRFCPDRSRAAS